MLWIWLAIVAGFLLLWYWIGELQAERLQADAHLANAIDKIEGAVREMQSRMEELGGQVEAIQERLGYDDAQALHVGKLPPLYPALYSDNGIVPRVFHIKTGLARKVCDIESGLQSLQSDLRQLAK